MKESQIVKILDEHIDNYLNNIAIELEESHDQWFDDFGFPLFGETSKEYYEQLYFQSYLESYTRQMINGILKDFFYEEVEDEIVWPEFDFKGVYRGFTNIEYEKEFGFEFINRGKKVGYRYSFLKIDEIDQLLIKGNVDNITLIRWESSDNTFRFHYNDERVKVVFFSELFYELFCELNEDIIKQTYALFNEKVSLAVKLANEMISLTTVPGFTPSYLFKTRYTTIDNLKSEVEQLLCFSVFNENYKWIEENSKQLINKYKLTDFFLEKRYEYAFVGTSDFAKSYLTSEYLYQFFKGNPMFDYTPIVSGYLKSIEQLLHILFEKYYEIKGIKKELPDTMGGYITEIKREKVFKKDLVSAKRIITACLDSYRAESRNHLFHYDFFDSWDRVEQIRNNTIFLYAILLGAFDPVLVDNPAFLGIINIEYDQLFCIIDKQKDQLFYLIIEGEEFSKIYKEPRNKGLIFNENGLILNSIFFIRFNYDNYEIIEINRTNMPSEVWVTDSLGNKKRRLWPLL